MKKISLTLLSMAFVSMTFGQKVVTPNAQTSPASPAKIKVEVPAKNDQPTNIKFETTTFDYGTIKEEKGPVTCSFKFKNIGKSDVQILNVRPSCGCTTSDYTKEPVKPGAFGFVKATYDPARRPGVFNKSIAVTTNDPTSPNVTLFIKGNVLEKPKTKEELFPVQQGALRFMTNHLSFNLTSNDVKIDTLKIYNAGKSPIEIKYERIPVFVTVLNNTYSKINPGAEGKIILRYDAAKRNEIGFVYDKFTLTTNDTAQLEKIVYLSANISEDFSKLTPEQMANAPVIGIEKESYDFGKVKLGAVVEYNYTITNNGKSKLIFRKVKASCGCTATQPEKMEVAPGETTHIKAGFNTAGRLGQQHKTITVITNDPKRSNITLTLTGEVIKDEAVEIKGDPKKGEGSGTIQKIK